MADIPRPKNPEDDWKVWLVVNPATWLIPILMSVFVLGILVHAFLFSVSPYGEYWGGSDAAAPAAEVAAPAPAAPAAE
jgi:hypothetical protein